MGEVQQDIGHFGRGLGIARWIRGHELRFGREDVGQAQRHARLDTLPGRFVRKSINGLRLPWLAAENKPRRQAGLAIGAIATGMAIGDAT